MLCQECQQNEATIHIVKNINGKQTELHLCEQCAIKKEELDFSFEPQFSLHQFFAGILEQGLQNSRHEQDVANLQCPSCGLTFAQFSQVGRLGCSECYKAFEKRMKPLLRRIHAGTAHTGKVPLHVQSRVRQRRELAQLKDKLKLKVENEEFEEAAVLRDQIRDLETRMQEGQKDLLDKGEEN
ncbi:MAG: hypothetical protein AVO34_08240 [Firmicutes bacterium ML8_F2]|jgi:protein arginine kinase activator|nr:MAG: hypothetical protein AVO34_08240 [Firmicutes bacterium ML8_F2]